MKTCNAILYGYLSAMVMLFGCHSPSTTYNILDFGAKGDGKTINTRAINKAIIRCNRNGGGTVWIPPGTYISGTVVLLSNVILHLDPGAVLMGSRDTSDYLVMNEILFNEGYNRYGLICARDAKNVSITGSGEINGNGTYFMNGLDKPHTGGGDFDRKYIRQGDEFMKPGTVFEDGPVSYSFRPGLLIIFERCEQLHITDVVLRDSPEWTIRIGDCDDVDVRGISILNNPLIPNNDGIHVTTSRNVRISDCNVFAGDDAIIVTGFGNSPLPEDSVERPKNKNAFGNKTGYAENITVTNCVLSSRSAGIRVGYGNHPIRNLVFSNLVIYDSNRGLGIFARDGSRIENVLFSNIIISNRLHSGHWWGKGEPIHISALRDSKNGTFGTVDNIRFSDITSSGETGILISGMPETIVKNIFLNNVHLTIHAGKYTGSYGGNFDLRPAYPVEFGIFKHDIPGLYAQYVKNLTVSHFELNWGEGIPSFFTHAVEVNHFEDLVLDDVRGGSASPSAGSAIKISDGKRAILRNCTTSGQTALITKENVK
jgi:polygalacturonase